jgi:hypothetical protein
MSLTRFVLVVERTVGDRESGHVRRAHVTGYTGYVSTDRACSLVEASVVQISTYATQSLQIQLSASMSSRMIVTAPDNRLDLEHAMHCHTCVTMCAYNMHYCTSFSLQEESLA